MRGRWRLLLGLAVSALFLYLALKGLQLDQFLAALRDADYVWLIPGVAIYFVGVWFRAWRWHYMLRHVETVSTRQLFPIVCIGYMGNNIYPARAGEVLRSYVLKQQYGVSMSVSLATVVIERLFDGLTMLLFVFVALPFVRVDRGVFQGFTGLVAGFTLLFLAALGVFLFLAARPGLARRVYEPVVGMLMPPRHRERVLEVADRFMHGFASLGQAREVVMIFGTSVLIWLCETMKYWFVMHAFPGMDVSFLTLMLMNGIVNLFTSIPGAPGNVGTFDLPGIRILEAAGVPQSVATAYTLVLHVALWLPVTALGGFYMWRSHLSVRQIRHELAEADAAAAAAAHQVGA
jgi:uncharacterized protein (TIRG00374 family)